MSKFTIRKLLATIILLTSAALAQFSPGGTTGKGNTAPAWYPQSQTAGPFLNYFEDFIACNTTNNYPLVAGNIGSPVGNAIACDDANQDVNHPGDFRITSGTGGAATGQFAEVNVGSGATFPLFTLTSATVGWLWESAVIVPVLPGTTAASYQAGVVGTAAASPWTTGIGFYLSNANGVANDWYCRYASTSTDSAVAATVGWVRLTMRSDATNVHWYINGVEVCGTGVAVASMPAGPFVMAWSNVAGSGTSVTLASDYVMFQRTLTR